MRRESLKRRTGPDDNVVIVKTGAERVSHAKKPRTMPGL